MLPKLHDFCQGGSVPLTFLILWVSPIVAYSFLVQRHLPTSLVIYPICTMAFTPIHQEAIESLWDNSFFIKAQFIFLCMFVDSATRIWTFLRQGCFGSIYWPYSVMCSALATLQGYNANVLRTASSTSGTILIVPICRSPLIAMILFNFSDKITKKLANLHLTEFNSLFLFEYDLSPDAHVFEYLVPSWWHWIG